MMLVFSTLVFGNVVARSSFWRDRDFGACGRPIKSTIERLLRVSHRIDTVDIASASIRVVFRVFAEQNIARIRSLIVSNWMLLALPTP